jgi:hypothetical protein
MKTLPTQTALEGFLRGFSTTRCFTKPFPVRQLAPAIWLLSDLPGAKVPTRTPEVVAYGAEAPAVLEALRSEGLERYTLCVLLDGPDGMQETIALYKSHGHRYHGREPLFALHIGERTRFEAVPIRRVVTAEDAALVAKEARSRQILPEHLVEGDSVCRLYAAFEATAPIGWVRSIRTHPDCTWVSNMFVVPDHRRKGIGRALLTGMLDDDARFGVEWSVLLASSAGAQLYPHLGYREQGILLIFTPSRKSKKAPA